MPPPGQSSGANSCRCLITVVLAVPICGVFFVSMRASKVMPTGLHRTTSPGASASSVPSVAAAPEIRVRDVQRSLPAGELTPEDIPKNAEEMAAGELTPEDIPKNAEETDSGHKLDDSESASDSTQKSEGGVSGSSTASAAEPEPEKSHQAGETESADRPDDTDIASGGQKNEDSSTSGSAKAFEGNAESQQSHEVQNAQSPADALRVLVETSVISSHDSKLLAAMDNKKLAGVLQTLKTENGMDTTQNNEDSVSSSSTASAANSGTQASHTEAHEPQQDRGSDGEHASQDHPTPTQPTESAPASKGTKLTNFTASDPNCKLEKGAHVKSVRFQKGKPCIWQAYEIAGECVFGLVGGCYKYRHKRLQCDFWGWPQNEQRGFPRLFLPGPAPGEITLTGSETRTMEKGFQLCHNRPRYYLATTFPLATPENPINILAGGSERMSQHFYFVLGEIAGKADSYRLGLQRPDNMQIIVDVGANIGLFSISACKRFPKARILAFEPHPANYRFLVHNLKTAGCSHVETYNKGISKDGRKLFITWFDSIGTSAYRGKTRYTLPMETLSPDGIWKLVGGNGTISYMKVDCEGCEYELVPLLEQWRVPKIVCEVHGKSVATGASAAAIKGTEKACAAYKPLTHALKN